MNQLLDYSGALLFLAYKIIVLPLLFILYIVFALMLIIKYINFGLRAVCRIKLRSIRPFVSLTKSIAIPSVEK